MKDVVIEETSMKGIKNKIFAVCCILCAMAPAIISPAIVADELAIAGPIGLVIGGIVVVLVTVALMNTVINNTKTVTANTNIDTSTKSMVTLLPFGVALMAFLGLFAWLL